MRKSGFLSFILAALMLISVFTACTTDTPEETSGVPSDTSAPESDAAKYSTITIAEALELCGEVGNITEERYYIRATVDSVDNAQYGAMTISDDTGSIYVYGTYSADGSISYAEMSEKPYKGDEVLLHCILQNYNGTKEVKNARLIEFVSKPSDVDESAYSDMSVAAVRDAASGTLAKVDGVVARITYAFGMKPSGFYLVDETQSVYVYDSDVAQRVAIGNKVTVLGSKTYWVLDSEKNNAEKFGYKGCCQLEDATLLSNDEKTDNAFDKSWIQESTVKQIMETPVSENITTSIYKVNALVKKVEGKGFVNYYFNDIDGVTGSYVYTQCSGSDFEWLDAFDGKICTVYLSAMNAKSTASDCIYRFLPILVEDNGFAFDTANTAEHVVKYYGLNQFIPTYSGNPQLELITSVSSELLGFNNATISYSSSDSAVISFDEAGGKTVMNCLSSGKVTVSITGSYGGKTYSESIEITVTVAENFESLTVGQAIAAAKGETVTVKGVVGPSLVNKSGFYLIDDSGVIAVLVDASVFDTINIGDEVVIKGTRHINTKGGENYFGQSCINDAAVLANYYGGHEYSTATFITDKTLADFYALDAKVDYSTSVFVLKATVNLVETAYYTNIELVNGGTKVSLYCSSAGQYSWLKAYAGSEVTLEVAACNWNDKTYYRGCVLAVHTEGGKVVNALNFDV